jgi:putative DNA primase/helicase
LFIYGPGGNGKSVFLNTVVGILGEYAAIAAMDTFTDVGNDRHLAFLAMLKGARMVTATETEEGRAWAEVKIKQLTGGDPITANFMRQNPFTFRPAFKLTIGGNHQPVLRNVDDAARRRLKMAPFTHKPPEEDRRLEMKLRAEWPGILRWMIEGGLDWQRNGLIHPKAVQAATAYYFSEQDTLAQWQEDCCETGRGFEDTAASLFSNWRNYALARSEEPGNAKRFSTALQRKGLLPCRDPIDQTTGISHRNQRGFKGFRVRVHLPGGDEG